MVMHRVHQTTPEAIKNTLPVDPEVDMVQSLLERIALLEQQCGDHVLHWFSSQWFIDKLPSSIIKTR